MIDLIPNEIKNFKKQSNFLGFLREQDKTKKEQTVEFKDWTLKEDGLKVKGKTYPLRDSGMKTLLRTFQMPVNFYYKKAPTDMLIRDINRMKEEYTEDSEIMMCTQDNEVRAITKPSHRFVRDTKVLERSGIGRNIFHSGSYSDYGIRVVTSDAEKPVEVSKGDVMNIGLELMSSDVGHFPTTGFPYLNRLVCTNGLVMREKHPLLNGFKMSYSISMNEDIFLDQLNTNIKTVDANGKMLGDTFKIMKKNPVKSLSHGEDQVKKIRNAVGKSKFDANEKLVIKMMIDEKEEEAINLDLDLYTVLDLTTRFAKEHDYLNR